MYGGFALLDYSLLLLQDQTTFGFWSKCTSTYKGEGIITTNFERTTMHRLVLYSMLSTSSLLRMSSLTVSRVGDVNLSRFSFVLLVSPLRL